MRTSTLLLLVATALSPALAAATNKQCYGYTPQPGVSSFLGATLDYSTAEWICCDNHIYAEYAGYLAEPEVDLFGRLDPDKETVFYDSVCGIPLFVAPRGRSFEDFKKESLRHGWPSFRPEEIVSENVIIHNDGRMESRCLTHLGHNLPEGGVDRYCIDLVCVAGAPLTMNDERSMILTLIDDDIVIDHLEFDATTYTSSAVEFSGKYKAWSSMMFIVGFITIILIAGIGKFLFFGATKFWKQKKEEKAEQSEVRDDLGTKGFLDTYGSAGVTDGVI